MLTTQDQKTVQTRIKETAKIKRELQELGGTLLQISKRMIFALHREEASAAQRLLKEAGTIRLQGSRLCKKHPEVANEGAWRAAEEEYAEAFLFFEYLKKAKIHVPPFLKNDPEILLGAVSDLAGELVRRAVRLAGQGDFKNMESMYRDVEALVEFLLSMDLTGTLRTKTDQARQHLRKMEEIRYDVSFLTKR